MVQGRPIYILLVNQYSAALALNKMGDIAHATWLFPRCRCQMAQYLVNRLTVRLIKRHPYSKTQHTRSFPYALSTSSNPGNVIV